MRSLLPLTVAALVVCALGRPSPTTQPRSLSADPPRLTIRPPVRASNATSLESTAWNPPSDMVNPLEQVWERTLKRRGANTTENEYWLIPKLMANNGSIKYCVNWNNTETVTSPQRVLIARALQKSMQEWVDVLVGFDGFPLTTVDVNVISYAAKSVNQIQGDTTGLDINTVTQNSKGEPECDPRCYRTKYLDSKTGMSECPGGDKSSYDMVLRLETMPTYPGINILGIATKDWQHFPDGPIGNQGGFLMIRPDYIIHVAEFDAWMLRDWWRKTKAHRNW
ncbi:hypothetical protein D6D23_03646 [Aureobasidium pullulans]|nr:hypothetical protein D6D23_03646 [Aureobasidium pullulans]